MAFLAICFTQSEKHRTYDRQLALNQASPASAARLHTASTRRSPSARWRSLFEARQSVRQFDPAELVACPDMTDRRICIWIIEATGGHVDGRSVFSPPVCQRCATAPTECPRNGRRRFVFNRFSRGECQVIHVYVRPRHDRRCGCLSTTAALTRDAHQRFALNSIPYCATQTSTLDVLAQGAPLSRRVSMGCTSPVFSPLACRAICIWCQ